MSPLDRGDRAAPIRVLQLQDSPDDAELELAQLKRDGLACESRRVETREAFEAALGDFKPDVILADYTLPQFDGRAAIEFARRVHPEIPIILVSGTIGEERAVELMRVGARDFVLKDHLGRLGASVRNALAEAAERRARKRAERALQESEERFRNLVENTSDIIAIARVDGTIVYASPAVRTVGGYDPQEVIGRSYFELVPPEDLGETKAHLAELMRRPGELLRAEMRFRHKDGSIRLVESIVRNLIDVPGVGGFVANMRDVTERRRAEDELAASRNLLRDIIERAPVRIFWKDGECRYLGCNTLLAHDAGKAGPDEVVGKDDFAMGWADRAELYRADDRQVMVSGEGKLAFEEPLTTREGQRWLRTSKVPLRDAAGKVCGVLGVFDDITELKQAEAAQHRALARAQAQLEALARVTRSEALAGGDVTRLAREITEVASAAAGAARSNVWLFDEAETELRCIDAFDAVARRHTADMVLKQAQFANEFAALKKAPYVDADDPLTDPRTTGYVEGYVKPLGITSMLDTVVRIGDRHVGLLCIEHVGQAHHWEQDEIAFACQMADKLGLCIATRRRVDLAHELAEAQRVAGLGSWQLDVRTGAVIWSEQLAQIFGRDPAQPAPSYDEYRQMMTPDSFARMDAAMTESRRSGRPYEADLEILHPSGEHRWIAARGEVLRDESGTVVAVRGTALDMTERRAAEAKLRAQLEELQRWQALNLDRESRVMELKREVNEALAKSGQPPKYASA